MTSKPQNPALFQARDEAYAVTAEMAARAQDPRCPQPLALVILQWVNLLNENISQMARSGERAARNG